MHKYKAIIIIIFLLLLTISTNAIPLQNGDRGEDVFKIQEYLNQMGYDITIDGIFGYETENIIKDFQSNKGLTVDGIVGKKTVEAIKESIKNIKYIIQEGDSLSYIAFKYDTTVEVIKEINNLNSDFIRIGQEIKIPKTGIGGGDNKLISSTIYHTVQRGDALSLIAKRYGVDIETIKLANNLRNDIIRIGQDLVIPHEERNINQPFQLQRGSFIWPVLGRISSPFGYRNHPINNTRQFHNGLDIAVPLGTEIRAAAAGKVAQSGFFGGYGKTIIIDHGNNVRTLYAHNSRLLVSAGDTVSTGQVIALAGSTGVSTGSHLHFTIYDSDDPVNPIPYLP
ncbi:peptidoglycan DD-metalloendopeptidase family protein [Natronospora cellulosivora (SeqCode)]